MTDQEIIEGLIARDERVTGEFFFGQCRPLICSIIGLVFNGRVDYDELVNELYLYLMENDAARLRGFEYRSSVYQWLKVLAIRYFIKRRDHMIDDVSHEPPTHEEESAEASHADEDLERLFGLMPNKRYVMVIKRLILEDENPEQLAREMNVTVANLYNIKRRAMAQLAHVALKDIQEYGKQQ
jgi:RNA polymerase sigma factor (sigma-70 family)